MPYQAITPDPGGYNIWSPLYAQSVAARTGNPGADVLNQLALAIRAGQEKGSYADAIQAANANQLAGSEMEARAKIDEAYINNLAEITKTGIGPGVYLPGSNVVIDPAINRQVGAVHLDNTAAQGIQRRADAIATIAESTDVRPTMPAISQMMGTPLQPEGTEIEPYISFDKNTDRMKAEASMLGAEASMVSANRPPSSGGGSGGDGDVKTYIDIPMTPGMPPTYRVVGDNPNAAQAAAQRFVAERDKGAAGAATSTRNSSGKPKPYILQDGKRVRNPAYTQWRKENE